MVLYCTSCGIRQPLNEAHFCFSCGFKLSTSGAVGTRGGTRPQTLETEGATTSQTLITPREIWCSHHASEDAIAFCDNCKDLACVICKGQRHRTCSRVLSVNDFLKKEDPFEDARRKIRDLEMIKLQELKELQDAKQEATAGVASLRQFEANVLDALKRQYDKELEKLYEAMKGRERKIKKSIQMIATELQLVEKNWETAFGSVKTEVEKLQACKEALSQSLDAHTAGSHVTNNKLAKQYLQDIKSVTHVTSDSAQSAFRDEDKEKLKSLADLPVEVRSSTKGVRAVVRQALTLNADHNLAVGKVLITQAYLQHCEDFAADLSREKPGEYEEDMDSNIYYYQPIDVTFVSGECARALASELGGTFDYELAIDDKGFVIVSQTTSTIVRYAINLETVFDDGTTETSFHWVHPGRTIRQFLHGLEKYVHHPHHVSARKCEKNGSNTIPTREKRWDEMWAELTVGSNGVKRLYTRADTETSEYSDCGSGS